MKKKAKNIIIGISILFLVLGVGYFGVSQMSKQTPSKIFIDKELGMISIGGEGLLVTQAFFSKTISTVNEQVQICDSMPIKINNYKLTEMDWTIERDGNYVSSFSILQLALSTPGTKQCINFIPKNTGRYEAITTYTYCPDIYGAILPSDCISRSSTDIKRYFLTVTSAENSCNKEPYTGSWYTDKLIDNGKILKAKVYKVTNDCTYDVNFYLVQTQCNDNYLIEDSNLRMTEGEGFKCVSAKTDDPILDEDNNEIIDDYEERDPECNIDFYETCKDGTEILSKLCVEGLYFDSGNICTEIGEPEEETPTEEITEEEVILEEEITDEEVKEIECISNIECQSLCGTLIPTCENNVCFCSGQQVFIEVEETPLYFYIIPVSIFGLVALIVWMKRKKPKRNI